MDYDLSSYPSTEDLQIDGDNVVPLLLKLFLECLVEDKLERSAIAQLLIPASRPRTSILPLPFALGVHLDRFGSPQLLIELSRLGFCMSYD
jgi:hypothetical protein